MSRRKAARALEEEIRDRAQGNIHGEVVWDCSVTSTVLAALNGAARTERGAERAAWLDAVSAHVDAATLTGMVAAVERAADARDQDEGRA